MGVNTATTVGWGGALAIGFHVGVFGRLGLHDQRRFIDGLAVYKLVHEVSIWRRYTCRRGGHDGGNTCVLLGRGFMVMHLTPKPTEEICVFVWVGESNVDVWVNSSEADDGHSLTHCSDSMLLGRRLVVLLDVTPCACVRV